MGSDIGYFFERSRRSNNNPIPEILSDQNLEAAFSHLHLSPYSHHPTPDITTSRRNSTLNQQHQRFLPYLSQTSTQSPNVEFSLPRLEYWTGQWDDGDVNEPCPTRNSLVGSRQWFGLGQEEELNGQLMRSTSFPNQNISSLDVLGYSKPNNMRSPSSSTVNNDGRVFHLLQNPLDYFRWNGFGGDLVALAKDQYGCRILQKTMEDVNDKKVHGIFLELIEYVGELMIDPFGNYVVQKLVEVCNEEQRTQILLMVTKTDFQLVSICLNVHGTRAVQKLLDHLTTQEQITLVMSAVSPGVVALTADMNGHHVIQHCLKHFSNEDNRYLLNAVIENCNKIATDKSGCCVLQHCVDYSNGDLKKRLIDEIISNSFLLATDRYGNYVVQHLLGLKMSSVTASLLRKLQGSYMSLSCNKYGSNVVEKCLSESGQERSTQIIMELLRNQNVSMLLVDPYGNYVIQTALAVSKGQTYSALLNLVRMNCPKMKSNPYGKKIIAWFQKKKNQHS